MEYRTFDADVERLIRRLRLGRTSSLQQPIPAPVLASSDDRYRAEGRIKVDATIVHGAPEGWFLPGNGKAEWFKDHEMGPEMVVVPAGKLHDGLAGDRAGAQGLGKPAAPGDDRTALRRRSPCRHTRSVRRIRQQHGLQDRGRSLRLDGQRMEERPKASWRNPGFPQDDSHPVVCVSWEDAKAFAAWLSSQSGRDYRLLTEAEWEYAARAGTTTPFWWGSTITPAQANYDGNYVYKGGGAKGEYREQTVAVGEFAANPWGLYQVHGNVWEWCEDVWHENYNGAPSDGSAWLQGGNADRHVVRGGSWINDPQFLRSAGRVGYTTDDRGNHLGFRVGRTLTP